ncbi:MAG: hypothetical protein OXE94_04675 [Aestuariivita sp.]|nr:hypothetical protein [Aestuariivita sp.]MCY4202574.1 hypothetical protein [Aestuariivita sp.]
MSNEPNWVKDRANCTAELARDILVGRLKSDMGESGMIANKTACLKGEYRDDCFFIFHTKLTPNPQKLGQHLVVEDKERDNEAIRVSVSDNAITACASGRMHLQIDFRWNTERQECDWLIDDVPYQVWKISEMIFGSSKK